MKNYSNYLIHLLVLIAFISCNKDNDSNGNMNGFALSSAKGHSFQFYTSTQWMFSVSVSSKGVITPKLQENYVASGNNTFEYQRLSDNRATCLVYIGFTIAGTTVQNNNAYSGDMLLTFDMTNGGYFNIYSTSSKEILTHGRFTVDEVESDTPPTALANPDSNQNIKSYPAGHNGWSGRMPVLSEFGVDQSVFITNTFTAVDTTYPKGEDPINSYATNRNTEVLFPASGSRVVSIYHVF